MPGDAANGSILGLHTDIIQLVQITEYADLREFRDSGKEDKAQVAVGTFQYAVKGFQGLAVIFQQGIVAEGLQQGFVVFVHQNHYAAACLFAGTADDTGETGREGVFIHTLTIFKFPLGQLVTENIT